MGFFNFGSSSGSGSGQSDETNDLYAESKRNRSSSLIIFVVIIVGYFLYSMFAQSASCAGQPTSTGRVKLAEGLCRFTEFVFPEIGTSVYTGKTDKADKMELGFQEEMVNFYNASGIQPVIYDKTGEPAMTQEELQAFADDFYENGLFSNPDVNDIHDEGHFLIVFQAAEDGSTYKVAYHVGTNAAEVFAPTRASDKSGVELFDSCLDSAFQKKTGANVFKTAFKDAKGKIMGNDRANTILIIVLIAAVLVYFAINFIRTSKKKSIN